MHEAVLRKKEITDEEIEKTFKDDYDLVIEIEDVNNKSNNENKLNGGSK